MTAANAARWSATRALVERFAAPVDLLATILKVQPGFIERKAVKERWSQGHAVQTLYLRLSNACIEQFETLSASATEMDAEKRARALASMAKTLETLSGVARTIDNREAEEPTCAKPISDGANIGFDREARDRRLSALLRKLSASATGDAGRDVRG